MLLRKIVVFVNRKIQDVVGAKKEKKKLKKIEKNGEKQLTLSPGSDIMSKLSQGRRKACSSIRSDFQKDLKKIRKCIKNA